MEIHRPLDSFTSVGEGETAVVALHGGPTYDEIHLEFPYSTTAGAEFTEAHITGVRLNLNAEDIISVSGSDLKMIDLYEGQIGVNGYLTISLKELIAKTWGGMYQTGLVTFPSDSISLEVDILGTGASAVVKLKGFASTSAPPEPYVREVIPKIKTYPLAATNSGPFEITTLPRGPLIKRVHFAAPNMTKLTIERSDNGVEYKLFELEKARAEYLSDRHKMVPQTGYFHFDPIMTGFPLKDEMKTGALSLVFRAEMSAPGPVNPLVESVWPDQVPFAGTRVTAAPVRRSRRRR